VTLPPLARWLELESGVADIIGARRACTVAMIRHAFAGELDGVGMAQLMRRKVPPHIRFGGEPTELDATPALDQDRPRVGPSNDAEQRSDRQLEAALRPGDSCSQPEPSLSDLAPRGR